MPVAVAAMAGLHAEAFLPSGAFDHNRHNDHYSHLPYSRSHSQRYADLASSHGFPPQLHATPPLAPPTALGNNTMAQAGSTRPAGRTSVPAIGSMTPRNGNGSGYFPSSVAYGPVPLPSSSLPIPSASDPPSNLNAQILGTASSSTALPQTNIDAAAYYGFAATASASPHDLLRGPAYSPPQRAALFANAPNYRPGQRASSLSPDAGTRKHQQYPLTTLHPHQQPSLAGSPPTTDTIGASLSRSVSADAAAPTQTPSHIVQRLTQQNAIIREAWEAERNYLEANRRRAEEVYQEERAIMEEVRESWETEKESMIREMQELRDRLHRLEGENTTLRAVAAQAVSVSGVVSPLPSVKDAEGSGYFGQSAGQAPVAMSISSSQAGGPDISALAPGLNGASRRPHWASPGGGASHTSPTSQPEQSPFIPLEPRVEPQIAAPVDPLPHEDEAGEPPIIDVQEVDPKLEGIPIRANALQRPTFGFDTNSHAENSKQSSPSKSPPSEEVRTLESIRPEPTKRASSKDHTLQVLAVGETRRLTMHAGHTPNHSLSLFPTMNVRNPDGSSNATAPSDGPTPKAETATLATQDLGNVEQVEQVEKHKEDEPLDKGKDPAEPEKPDDAELELGPLEPVDDVPLKGPLMIKNIPAQDEIFWSEVNKKLEPISQGRDSLPTVMRADLEELEEAASSSAQALLIQQQQPRQVDPVGGGDASQDSQGIEDGDIAPRPGTSGDGEVPLKLRTTTNFGAPFGVA